MGISNAIMVCYGDRPRPPFAPHAEPLCFLDRLVWSVIGDSSSTRNDDEPDLEALLALSEDCQNLVGGIMDDFFHAPADRPEKGIARHSKETMAAFQQRLHRTSPPLDLWVVFYDEMLDAPYPEHLDYCDVITFWTWHSETLFKLEKNFEKLEQLAPSHRKLLGCYMWDYGGGKPMPVNLMQHQCALGLEWLRAGRLDGMIFLASNLCGLDVDTVAWTGRWIADVGDERL
ncbi:MAG: hypothetical protein ACLFWL_03165 [Candidatus Brocadiia bacterium]